MIATGVAGSLADLVYGYFFACARGEGNHISKSMDRK